MCGRFYLDVDFDDILKHYGDLLFEKHALPKNVFFPTDPIPVITKDVDQFRLSYMYWGFTPDFAKRPIINARTETVFDKQLFQQGILHNRCLIPATGYFEWLHSGAQKTKHRVTLPDQKIFSMAGIYKVLTTPKGMPYYQVSILTCNATPEIAWLHDRMPLILPVETEKEYLKSQLNSSEIQAILQTTAVQNITAEPVEKTQLSFLEVQD